MTQEKGQAEEQGLSEPTVPVVGEPVSDADLVPDNRDVEEVVPTGRLDPVGGMNAGGSFGHTPDHGDANVSRLAGDPESEGADHSASDDEGE